MNGVFDCDDCGRRIPQSDSHVVLTSGSVTCMKHYVTNLDAGRVETVLSRQQAIDLLESSLRRPYGPERATPRRGHR